MKTMTLWIFLSGMVLLPLSASPHEARWGVKAGFNLSKNQFSHDPFVSNLTRSQALPGFSLGLLTQVPLTETFSLQGEVAWSRKGLKYDTHALVGDVQHRLALDYLEVPLMIKWHPIATGPISPVLLAGPYAAYRMSAKDREGHVDEKGHYKKFDWGFCAGLGIDMRLKSSTLCLDVRYTRGLANIMTQGYIDESGHENKGYTQTLSANLGFSF